jgi:putative SOS response-associated peptidase YedK
MCGRYQRRSDKQKIAEAFHLGNVDGLALELAPGYNVAPQTISQSMKDDQLFALGGVWGHWRSPDRKQDMATFAIITVEPNELVAETTGHDRMPLIIAKRDWQRWLEPGDPQRPPPIVCARSTRQCAV